MTGDKEQPGPERTVSFTDRAECPYFADGRTSMVEFRLPTEEDHRNYHEFLARGFRRMGRAYYHNVCEGCSSCVPMRIETDRFILSRSHKRALKKNSDIKIQVLPRPEMSREKIALYDTYVKSKHSENGDEDIESAINVLINIHYGYPGTLEMNYYLNNRLIGVGIVDEGRDALSSNYFYYDTDHLDRRPGVFSILKEIELAKSLGKKYYYLGFYIAENPKMSYKKYFRPNQVYDKGRWIQFSSCR